MPLPVTISVDLVFFLRIFAAFCWGILYALFLQHHRIGKYWARERTWVAVVVGIGVDFIIAINGDWLTVLAVTAVSAIGIIGRSLSNEQKGGSFHRNKVLWNLEDAIALCIKQAELLHDILSNGKRDTEALSISQAVSLTHQIKEKLVNARKGEYEQ